MTAEKPIPIRASKAAAVALATAITAGAVGGAAYVTTRGGESGNPEPLPTPAGDVQKTTAPATTFPTEKPTVPPTEKHKTPQELIDIARKAHQDALGRGEFRLPEPDSVLSVGGRIDQGGLTTNGERDLFIVVPPGKDIPFPSLIDGEVIEAKKANQIINLITIREGGKNLNIIFPVNGNIKVQKGDKITIGTQLFSIKYDPESPTQKTFENTGNDKKPQGTVAILNLQDSTAGPGTGFQDLSINNGILLDQSGNPLKIPTLVK